MVSIFASNWTQRWKQYFRFLWGNPAVKILYTSQKCLIMALVDVAWNLKIISFMLLSFDNWWVHGLRFIFGVNIYRLRSISDSIFDFSFIAVTSDSVAFWTNLVILKHKQAFWKYC